VTCGESLQNCFPPPPASHLFLMLVFLSELPLSYPFSFPDARLAVFAQPSSHRRVCSTVTSSPCLPNRHLITVFAQPSSQVSLLKERFPRLPNIALNAGMPQYVPACTPKKPDSTTRGLNLHPGRSLDTCMHACGIDAPHPTPVQVEVTLVHHTHAKTNSGHVHMIACITM
jgi:hypothetical protein